MCARSFYSYIHLILALGIVREPTVRGFTMPKYSCTPARLDIGHATEIQDVGFDRRCVQTTAAARVGRPWRRRQSAPRGQ